MAIGRTCDTPAQDRSTNPGAVLHPAGDETRASLFSGTFKNVFTLNAETLIVIETTCKSVCVFFNPVSVITHCLELLSTTKRY